MSNSSALNAASGEGTINQLEAKIRYLERYLGRGDPLKGEMKLKNIMRRGGFSGFTSFKVYLNEDKDPPQWHNTHVDFLRRMSHVSVKLSRA